MAIPELEFDVDAAIEKIKQIKAGGKRGMIVAVSEGIKAEDGRPIGEYLTEKIEAETGIETRFARFAHIVRGGSPTLRDRLTATIMGAKAVELLLEGKSNLVICEIDGAITPVEINFALILDRKYKKKLKEGDLDNFTEEQVAEMDAICEKRHAELDHLYKLAKVICK
jgi:6-phosphofructokinase 1